MPQITWKNVDAPSAAEALRGIELSNVLLNKAVAGAQGGLQDIKNLNQDAANRAIIGRLNAITDPVALQQGIADGSIVGPDSANMSAALLERLPGAVDTRLKSVEVVNSYTRVIERQKAMDAFKPYVADLNAAAFGGDIQKIEKLMSLPEYRNLDATAQNEVLKTAFGFDTNAFNSMKSRAEYRIGEENRLRGINLDNLSAQVGELLTGTAKSDFINQQNIPERDKAELRRRAGITSTLAAAAGDIVPPTAGTYDPALNATVMYGGQKLADGITTLGAYSDEKNAGMFRRKTDGSLESTAFGSFQINRDTILDFAPKVFGNNWQNVPLDDYQAQYRLGEAVFNSTKGDPKALQGRWASLKDRNLISEEEVTALAKMPWDQAAPIISGLEHGQGQDPVFRSQTANQLINVRMNEVLSQNPGAASYFQDLSDSRDTNQVVTDAINNKQIDISQDDPNRGEVYDALNNAIALAKDKAGVTITPAMAMKYLLNSQEETSWYLPDTETGETTSINEDRFLAEVGKHATGATFQEAQRLQTLKQTQTQLAVNAQNLAKAKQEYELLLKLKDEGKPVDRADLNIKKAAYEEYNKQTKNLLKQVGGTPGFLPSFQNTKEEPKPASPGSNTGKPAPTTIPVGLQPPGKPKDPGLSATAAQRSQYRLEQEAYRAALEKYQASKRG